MMRGLNSALAGIVSLILVVLTAKATATNYLGLVERFMVSTYQVYYFVLALMVFLNSGDIWIQLSYLFLT